MFLLDSRVKYASAINSLKYPAEWQTSLAAFAHYFDFKSVSYSSLLSVRFSKKLRAFSRRELLLIHKFSNTFHFHNLSLASLHELIRRDLAFQSLFMPHGVWRTFCAYFLLCSASFSFREKRIRILKYICRFLLPLLRTSTSAHNLHPARSKPVIIVGGGELSKEYRASADSNAIIATINPNPEYSSPDIMFLRGERLRFINDNQDLFDSLPKETFYSLKTRSKIFRGSTLLYTFTKKFDGCLGYGSLNGVPSACWDCFVNQCKSIEIHQANFNLGPWAKSQRPSSLPIIKPGLIFGAHPAYLQFLFIKTLSCLLLVRLQPNPYVSLEMSPLIFIKKFRKVYPYASFARI